MEWILILVTALGAHVLHCDTVAAAAADCRNAPIDFVFLLDSSGSMGDSNFDILKKFIADFAKNFDLGPTKAQIGVVTFGDAAYKEFDLNRYHDQASLKTAINDIQYDMGQTYTHEALKIAREQCFQASHGDRPTAPNIVILLTDGKSSQPSSTKIETDKMKQTNARVIAVGIGHDKDVAELHQLASTPQDVFSVDSFGKLNTFANRIRDEACAVDGGWSNWGTYSHCSKTCGNGGTKHRDRTCSNPAQMGAGQPCTGPGSQSQSCSASPCPAPKVDGGWSSYGGWSACPATCGGGMQTRTRTCSNPTPSGGGSNCVGVPTDIRPCGTVSCTVPVDGGWTHWGSYSGCSKTCDGGTQSRTRSCTNPAPSGGGHTCPGSSSESTPCNSQACPTAGGGGGATMPTPGPTTTSTPTPGPTTTSTPTPGPTTITTPTPGSTSPTTIPPTVAVVKIDGGWSSFGSFSACSAHCGGGKQYRDRTCTNPTPSGGGSPCVGSSRESQNCNTQPCVAPTGAPVTGAPPVTTTTITTTTTSPASTTKPTTATTTPTVPTTQPTTTTHQNTASDPSAPSSTTTPIGSTTSRTTTTAASSSTAAPGSSTPTTRSTRPSSNKAGAYGILPATIKTIPQVDDHTDWSHITICVVLGAILISLFIVFNIVTCKKKNKNTPTNPSNKVEAWGSKPGGYGGGVAGGGLGVSATAADKAREAEQGTLDF